MVKWSEAYTRLRTIAAFARLRMSDFRPLVQVQNLGTIAAGVTSAATNQAFPGGAIILGITSCAYIPSAAGAAGQSPVNRQLYGLSFSYTNNESLTPGGPVVADALLGGGQENIFPSRELVLSPNQSLTALAVNYTTGNLVVQIAYHCMVYRLQS